MYEGNPPKKAAARSGEELRELTWSDLVARLSAVRDLRRALDSVEGEASSPASFDVDSARRISEHANGKDAINQTASAYRKTPRSRMASFVDRNSRGLKK